MLITLLTLLAADPVCTPQRPQNTLAARASQYDSVTTTVGTAVVKICYGRPKLNGRTMFGSTIVPYGKLWRTGANEPTILHTTGPIVVAGVPLAAGSYSMYTIPEQNGPWAIIFNRSISQWGIETAYVDDVVAKEVKPRGKATPTALTTPTEIFTLHFVPGVMHLVWEKTQVNIPIVAGK